jgi:sulfate permease, SulP family
MNPIFSPKLFTVLKKGYGKQQLINDITAGIVVGIVALPLAIAFAVASGVSPEKGLVTAVVAGFIISFLGGSRVQIGGPTGAFIVIVLGIVTQYGYTGLVISTIMAGVFLIVFGLLRLGSLLKYIPHPLITGFTSGIALIIFTTQIKDALGLNSVAMPSEFFAKWGAYFAHLSEVNMWALALTVGTILIILLFNRLRTVIPGSFIAIILATAATAIFKLPVATIETVFGEIPSKLQLSMPDFAGIDLSVYLMPALTIALLGAIESLLSAVVADGMISSNHRSNTELIAQGIANVVTPFFGGIPATGAIARTATNIKSGGRTPIAGIVHAITLLLIVMFFGKWAKLIPLSCLAGVLIVVAYNMSEWRTFYSTLKSSAFDIIILLTTFILTVLVDLTVAIEIGIVLSALLFMKRMADAGQLTMNEIDSDIIDGYKDIPSSIRIFEISGPFFFASAKQYCEVIKTTGLQSKILIIRMRHVPFMDSTGLNNLKEVVKQLQNSHIKVLFSGVRPQVKADIDKKGITDLVSEENIFSKFDDALKSAVEMTPKKK